MNNNSALLADLAESYWRFECYEMPLAAALAGQPLADAVLFRESQDDHHRRERTASELLTNLQAISAADLSAQERATLRLLQRELEGIRSQFQVLSHLRPSLLPLGPDFLAVYWANATNIPDLAAAEIYVARLAGIPAYLRDIQANIEAAQSMGICIPRAVRDGAMANSRNILSMPIETSPWLGPFRRSPAAAQPNMQAQADAALALVRGSLEPALRAWSTFLDDLSVSETLSCVQGPKGEAFYQVLVRNFSNGELTPSQIHDLGLQEVQRLLGEMENVAVQAGYAADLPGYRAFLASDPQFFAKDAGELLGSMESLCKRIDKRIPAFFGRIPRITYGVDSIPEAMSSQLPPAYAQPSPADGSGPGIFWVSGLPTKCPSYLYPAMALHEAWPGHLMHMALMNEQTELPTFRRFGAVKYTACVEGWALYCETLGIEMGVYTTPHEHYGRLEMEMWRAVRLVVDTGIHLHHWRRDQAIDYMAQNLTLSRATIESEVDRYASLPAQALGYQIGNLKLRELRQRAEARLGARFSHRNFHEAVMTAGAVTLPVLEDLVVDWLNAQIVV
ncbi:MAG: DUF885 domain-containing protein [Burkholderiales bacterium]